MRYLRPTTVEAGLEALSEAPLSILAGGTDFFPALKDAPVRADTLDISALSSLRGMTRTDDGGWRIGANTTWTDLIRAPLPPAFDGLKAAAREVGSIQIQNAATILGNLCNASPAADGVPCLLTLDASVELASVSGTRALPLDRFITGIRETALRNDELATAILVPPQPQRASGSFLKLGSRRYLVISIAMVACIVVTGADGRIVEARVAVGACSPVAQRLRALETMLVGMHPTGLPLFAMDDAKILAPLSPIDDVRGTGAYRMEAVRALITRAVASAAEGATA